MPSHGPQFYWGRAHEAETTPQLIPAELVGQEHQRNNSNKICKASFSEPVGFEGAESNCDCTCNGPKPENQTENLRETVQDVLNSPLLFIILKSPPLGRVWLLYFWAYKVASWLSTPFQAQTQGKSCAPTLFISPTLLSMHKLYEIWITFCINYSPPLSFWGTDLNFASCLLAG